MATDHDRLLADMIRGERPWAGVGGLLPEEEGRLWDRIRFHGIAYLVAERLESGAASPDELAQRIRTEAQLQAFWEESHASVLRRLFARLQQAGVAALALKGTALAYSLYAEPAARRRGDSDLLVQQRDLAPTRKVLHDLGLYLRRNPHGLQHQETWLCDTGIGFVHAIDLHWQPSESPVMRTAMPADGFFARAQPLGRLHEHARMPSFVDTFIQGAFNQAWHGRHGYLVDGENLVGHGRLIWMIDNARLMATFAPDDWESLTRSARDHGFAPICLAALEQAEGWLGAEAPVEVLDALRKAPQKTVLVKRIESTNLIECFLADLAALPRWRDKAAFILAHALPSRAHVREKYPAQAAWPLPLLYARRGVEAVLRWRALRSR